MEDLILAVNKIADTSFDASKTTIAERRSGSAKAGFYRPGERAKCLLDIEGHPPAIESEPLHYPGPPSGRVPTANEKRAAWQLQDEYLAGRLGKTEEENCRLWNTAKWIDIGPSLASRES